MRTLVFDDQPGIGALILVKNAVAEIRGIDRAGIPAARIKIALEPRVYEAPPVAGVDLVAGQAALLGVEASQIVLGQIARVAMYSQFAAESELR